MKRRRDGISLIEALVAMAIGSTVLTTIAITTHTLYRSGNQLRETWEEQRNIARLIIQLRLDSHLALSAATPSNEHLVLQLPNKQVVRYSLEEGDIERRAMRDEKMFHRETFSLRARPQTTWSLRNDQQITLTLHRTPTNPTLPESTGRTQQIHAALNVIHAAPGSGVN